MKTQTKKLSAIIALIAMMTIAFSMISPAFSVVDYYRGYYNQIGTSIVPFAEPATIGVGQDLSIQCLVYPPPADAINVTIRLTAPNGTNLYLNGASGQWTNNSANIVTITRRAGAGDYKQLEYFVVFKPDAVGKWLLYESFAGVSNENGVYGPSDDYNRRVIWVQAAPVTMPPKEIVTVGFIGTAPKKIATGESMYIVAWVTPPRELQGGIFFSTLDVTITKPDGTSEVKKIYLDSPATGSFNYLCSTPGTYSAVATFAGDVYPTFKFLPCTSQTVTWTVEDGYETPRYPAMPLPTGQWKYPINAEYRDWYQISGAWARSGPNADAEQSHYNEYTKGPNSAHVLWRKGFEGSIGGLMGGSEEYGMGGGGKAFTGSLPGFVSWQGRLWYATTERAPSTTAGVLGTSQPVVVCLDQFTGEELWRKTLPGSGSVSLQLQLLPREKIDPRTEESQGVTANLWAIGSGLRLLSPFTGECSYYNSTFTPTMYYNHRFYYIGTNSSSPSSSAGTNGTLIQSTSGDSEAYCLVWDTEDRVDVMKIALGRDYRTGYLIDFHVDPIRLVKIAVSYGMWPMTTRVSSWRLDTGEMLANGTDIPGFYCTEGAPQRCNVGWGYLWYHSYSTSLVGVDTATGLKAWESEPQIYPWGDFNSYNLAHAYHLVMTNSWDGHLYAYVAETGELAWKVFFGDSLAETAMDVYVPYGNTIVGDYKCYTVSGQHTQPSPPSRGDRLICNDALTGEIIWQYDHFQRGAGGESLASGVLTYGNAYDGMTYAFAKGPTEVTVETPLTAQPLGTSVLIQGTVMDMSPGAPNTPCVSDASQNAWMQYLHNNHPKPTEDEVDGVVVHLEYVGADGVVKDLTHVTSDLNGKYQYAWTPPAEGTYRIIATLDPTESYWSSTNDSGLLVAAAHETVEPEAAPDYTMLMYGIIGAVIAAIVIGIVSLMLILRKK